MALINCPSCGKPISDKASHCPKCGYSLIQQESEQPKPQEQTKPTTPKPKSNSLKWLLGLAILIGLGIIAVLIILSDETKKQADAEETEAEAIERIEEIIEEPTIQETKEVDEVEADSIIPVTEEKVEVSPLIGKTIHIKGKDIGYNITFNEDGTVDIYTDGDDDLEYHAKWVDDFGALDIIGNYDTVVPDVMLSNGQSVSMFDLYFRNDGTVYGPKNLKYVTNYTVY